MGLVYKPASGCSFKPTPRRSLMKRHLQNQMWCPCRERQWTIDDAVEGQVDGRRSTDTDHRQPPATVPQAVVPAVVVQLSSESWPIEIRTSDGYLHASALAKAAGKNVANFYGRGRVRQVVNRLSEELSMPVKHILQVNPAGGVWAHPRLRLHLLSWCDQQLARRKHGYVYLATCDHLDAVKVGKWRGAFDALRSRYLTPYGPTVYVAAAYVGDCRSAEQALHLKFSASNIGGELFEKSRMVEVIADIVELQKTHPQPKCNMTDHS